MFKIEEERKPIFRFSPILLSDDFRVSMRVLSYNEERQTKTSFLEIVRISESDAGYYKCIISGGKTGGGAETNVAQLQIGIGFYIIVYKNQFHTQIATRKK